MRINTLAASFLLLLVMPSINLDAQKLTVRLKSGIENSDLLSAIQKLFFADNQLIVDFRSGNDDVYELSDVQKLSFDAAVFIDDQDLSGIEALRVYPNPARSYILVTGIPACAGPLSVFRSDGALVLSIGVASEQVEIDVSPLSRGLYIIQACGHTTKFIRQ